MSDPRSPAPDRIPETAWMRGRYLLIGEIGKGGMGVVHRAYDPKLQREVALKCVRPDRASPQTRGRLIREARAMAQLNHRNVVRVYDVESWDEQLLLAMELVEGQNLRAWLRAHARPWTEVVRLLCDAGDGLAAAHRAGLLHRDFKPANVLVCTDGEVKVTDFGMAQVDESAPNSLLTSSLHSWTGDELPDSADLDERLTEDGQVVGTPAYMPPEQLRGGLLTTAADQYAFCSSVWEALTGRLPFEDLDEPLRGRALLARKRAGPPSWPTPGPAVPRRIIDVIGRGLSPDPADRWPSMYPLLEALRRNPSRRRRHWVVAAALPALVAAGLGARAHARARSLAACDLEGDAIATAWNDARARSIGAAFSTTQVPNAATAWDRVRARIDPLVDDWRRVRTAVCVEAEVDGTRSAQMLARARSCLDEHSARIRTLAEQWSAPTAEIIDRAVNVAWRLSGVDGCSDDAELRHRTPPPADPTQRQTSQALLVRLAEAAALESIGKCDDAEQGVEQVLRDAIRDDDASMIAKAHTSLGLVHDCQGHYDQAEQSLRRGLAQAYALGDDMEVIRAVNALVLVVGLRLARHDEGKRWAWFAHMTRERLGLADDHPLASDTLNRLAIVHTVEGSYPEAEAGFRRVLTIQRAALGEDHPALAATTNNLGNVLQDQGLEEDALVAYQRALAIHEATVGPDHLDVAIALNNIGNVHLQRGEYEQAGVVFRRALSIRERSLAPGHPLIASTLTAVGNVEHGLGRYEQSIRVQRRALEAIEASVGPDHPHAGAILHNMGLAMDSMGQAEESIATLRRALDIRSNALGADHPDVAQTLHATAKAQVRHGDPESALVAFERALEIRTKRFGPRHVLVGQVWFWMGRAEAARGRSDDAADHFERAVSIFEQHPDLVEPAEVTDALA
ncbi:MAG: tetratricopeptide repeat protein, partial [Deltaproteobacteria bacterium]|nr:tetratricopeptide repeat protein [Deltaproteobacteria bacterium]